MTRQRQLMIWSGVLLALAIFLFLFSNILTPFIFGATIAYFCDPIADWFEKQGLPRLAATAIIIFTALLVIALLMIAVFPLLLEQLSDLLRDIPGYLDALRQQFDGLMGKLQARTQTEAPADVAQAAGQMRDAAQGVGLKFLQGIWSGSVAFVSAMSVMVVTPVVAFYLLLDWDRMIARVDELLPRRHVDEVRKIARDIDGVLAGFMRGQFLVCIIQGTFYVIGLSIIGLDFALFVGLISGMASFIPYVGSILGLVLSMGLAFAQFWGDWTPIFAVLCVFLAGQVIEGNFLTPYLVGGNVGLHPVWLIFSLAAFGSLFGFAGLLLAVPAAASVGVLTRYSLARYRESPLYMDNGP